VIQTDLKDPLADDLLFGKLAKGGRVRVDLADGELVFEVASD
jgi:ATP-dependent Clp protease ATP-binding subunit ClpA